MGVRPEHGISTVGHSTTPCNKLVNRTCSYRVLLYIPTVISLSGWLLRGDASTFQYYFSKPSFQCFNGIEQPCHYYSLSLTADFPVVKHLARTDGNIEVVVVEVMTDWATDCNSEW